MLCLAGEDYSHGFLLLTWRSSSAALPLSRPASIALISRRSDPARQGSILGVAQSISSLARILGPMTALPLFFIGDQKSPFWLGIALMGVGLALVIVAGTHGHDYPATSRVRWNSTAGIESDSDELTAVRRFRHASPCPHSVTVHSLGVRNRQSRPAWAPTRRSRWYGPRRHSTIS